jgi:predicted transporter
VIYDAVSDGKHILYGMLITALVFLAVIGLGELTRWAGHRRKVRKRGARAY